MSSIQERLQLKRIPLDKWSVKEKLCLANLVSCSGNDWMIVSRNLEKLLCQTNRPNDWFSQKCCAAQYGKLLENVETPKRKKRTASEAAETPSESILRNLTQERISELKKIIHEEQIVYMKCKDDVNTVQTSDEAKLREMWNQIDIEKKQKQKDQQAHQQWLKEREERKKEMERAWRPTLNLTNPQNNLTESLKVQQASTLTVKIKSEDMEVDETTSKSGTSPLLTSLLKTPSPAPTTAIITAQASVRNLEPTLTNLLQSSDSNFQTIEQSIPFNVISVPQIKTQQQPTSSQSAPTLSMLLETKQNMLPIFTKPTTPKHDDALIKFAKEEEDFDDEEKSKIFQDIIDSNAIQNEGNIKDDDQQLMDVFNGLIPDNIDELADILTENNAIILEPELLEDEDPILSNVDSIISDKTVDQDKNVGSACNESTSHLKTEVLNKTKSNPPELQLKENIEFEVLRTDLQNLQEEIKTKSPYSSPSPKIEELPILEPIQEHQSWKEKHNENKIISDDLVEKEDKINESISQNTEILVDIPTNYSNQNLKSEVSLLSKENDNIVEKTKDVKEVLTENASEIDLKSNQSDTNKIEINVDIKSEITDDQILNLNPKEEENNIIIPKEDLKTEENNDGMDEILDKQIKEEPIQDVEEIECNSSVSERKLSSDDEDNYEDPKDSDETNSKEHDINHKTMEELETLSISLIDTDDDSPIEVIKEDKVGRTKRDYSRKKSEYQQLEMLSSTSKKTESDNNDSNKINSHIRMKLKERERSESPFIFDDDGNDGVPRTRRRYSSTPNIDSIPNSPASSEDRDYKTWKKAILIIYNRLITHKYASIFSKQITEDQVPGYKTVVLRSMDLQTIKRNIDSGVIRTTNDFQRDIMLMCHNAIIFNKKDTNIAGIAKEMMSESIHIIETTMEGCKRDEKSNKGRGGRKSSRVSGV